jgi:two-component system, LytTR family, response regulator
MTQKYQAIIIDDEEIAIKTLERLLQRFCPDVEIIGTASDVDTALNLLNTLSPHVVFLDMDMSEMKGFELIKLTSNKSFEIIVTSGHEEYALQGIKNSVLDYLIKPIDPFELKAAVQKLPSLSKTMESSIMIADLQNVYIVKVSEIIYIKADRAQTDIIRRRDKKINKIAKALTYYESILPAEKFYRCHSSYLISLEDARMYIKGESTVVLSNGEHIPVARDRKDGLWAALQV